MLPSVASQAILLDTMEFWERRPAALSDVTKRENAPRCKQTSSTQMTANYAKVRSATSATAAHQQIERAPGRGPFCVVC